MAVILYVLVPPLVGRLEPLVGARRSSAPAPSGPPAVRVLRPFARIAVTPESDLFNRIAEDPSPSPAAARSELVLLSPAAIGSALGGPSPDDALFYRWQADPQGPRPVLVAAPSWTFAAPPVSFHFVTARGQPSFPIAPR